EAGEGAHGLAGDAAPGDRAGDASAGGLAAGVHPDVVVGGDQVQGVDAVQLGVPVGPGRELLGGGLRVGEAGVHEVLAAELPPPVRVVWAGHRYWSAISSLMLSQYSS